MTALDSARTLLALCLQIATNMFVPWLVVHRDVARIRADWRARCWPETTLLASVVAFGPLCLPVHFVRTRRRPLGLVLGLVWMLAAFVLSALVGLIAP
ncbi:MAG: hypothetical protein JW940_14075 [Polyangiaceae bacterium]|nr:hypothetical protein [Polyangiaceae bacterium]